MRYELLSVQEAATILGVHRMTVYRMVEDGRLEVVAKVGSSIALERADVMAIAEAEAEAVARRIAEARAS